MSVSSSANQAAQDHHGVADVFKLSLTCTVKSVWVITAVMVGF